VFSNVYGFVFFQPCPVPFPQGKLLLRWLYFMVDNGVVGNPLISSINAYENLSISVPMDPTQFSGATGTGQAQLAVRGPEFSHTVPVKNAPTLRGQSLTVLARQTRTQLTQH
jgi:hypothetical protein